MTKRRGDLRACLEWLGSLKKTLGELDSLPRKLSTAAAPRLNAEFQKQFRDGKDPYGKPWARLKRTGQQSHLTESGRFKRGSRIAPMPGNRKGVRVILGKLGKRGRNPIFHMTGTKTMVARKYLPTRGMPEAWRKIIREEMKRALKVRVA